MIPFGACRGTSLAWLGCRQQACKDRRELDTPSKLAARADMHTTVPYRTKLQPLRPPLRMRWNMATWSLSRTLNPNLMARVPMEIVSALGGSRWPPPQPSLVCRSFAIGAELEPVTPARMTSHRLPSAGSHAKWNKKKLVSKSRSAVPGH